MHSRLQSIGLLEERKCAAGILSLIFSVLLTYLACLLISDSYKFTVDMSAIKDIFAVPIYKFAPEPLERTLFLSSLIIVPVSLLVFYKVFIGLFNRIADDKAINIVYKVLYFGITGLFCLAAWAGIRNDGYFYLRKTIGIDPTGLFIVGVSTAAIYLVMVYSGKNSKIGLLSKVLQFVFNLFSMALIVLVALYGVYGINSVTDEGMYNNHFNSVFHSVVQVYLGKELLVDLFHMYGMYPHFIEPIFRVFGLSVLGFTILMGLLMGLAVFMVYEFLKEITDNKLIGYLGFIATIYYCYIFGRIITKDPYFQYYPLRFIFPALSIYLVYRYFRSRNENLYYFSFFIYSVAILWNFDTGFVVFASWILVLLFQESIRLNLKNMLLHITRGLAMFTAVFILFNLYLYFRYGHIPAYNSFFVYQKTFYAYGFMMMPMNLIHPWNLVALVYAVGLLFSFISMTDKSDSIKAKMLFFLSVSGAGLFVYYQGRSNDFNLATVSFPAIIIMTVLADSFLNRIKAGSMVSCKFVFACALFFALFCTASMVINYPAAAETVIDRLRPTLNNESTPVTRGADFIKNNTTKGEEILLLSNLSGIYYLESGTTCPLKIPGPTELFMVDGFRKIFRYLEEGSNKRVVVDADFIDSKIYQERYLEQIRNALDEYYKIAAVSPDGNLSLYTRR